MRRVRKSYCLTCKRIIDSMGIASHRAAHMRRNETCTIELSGGERWTYTPKPKEQKDDLP